MNSYFRNSLTPPGRITHGAKHKMRVRLLLFFVPFGLTVTAYSVWVRHNVFILNISVMGTLLVMGVWPYFKPSKSNHRSDAILYWYEDPELSELMVGWVGIMYLAGALFFVKECKELLFILFGPVPSYWMPWGPSYVMENSCYVRGTSIIVAGMILSKLLLQTQDLSVTLSHAFRQGAACFILNAALCTFVRLQLLRAGEETATITAASLKQLDSSEVKRSMLKMHVLGSKAPRTSLMLDSLVLRLREDGATTAVQPVLEHIMMRRGAKQELIGIWFFVYTATIRYRLEQSAVKLICEFLPAMSSFEWKVACLRNHEETSASDGATHSYDHLLSASSVDVIRHRLLRLLRQHVD